MMSDTILPLRSDGGSLGTWGAERVGRADGPRATGQTCIASIDVSS